MLDLYDWLAARYPRARRDRRHNVFIPCPWCGKEGQHFSFSPRGAHCFVCGKSGSLVTVARQLGIDPSDLRDRAPQPPPRPRPKPAVPWTASGVQIISRSLAHPDRLARWAAYKPLQPETLNRCRFGLWRLPFQDKAGRWYWSNSYWLTVPLFDGASGAPMLVGLRGRNLDPAGQPKWISATGTKYVLWNLAGVRPGGEVWICENYVDAAWLMERHTVMDAVALGGAAHWRDEWAGQLAARRPKLVVVALDNDLAGQATGAMYKWLAAARQAAGKPEIVPNGPRIAGSLVRAGLRAHVFRWPPDAPEHADVGWLLAQESQ